MDKALPLLLMKPNKLVGLVYMNLKLLPIRQVQASHKDLGNCLPSFAVLNLKNAVGMLMFDFQQLFDKLEEPLDKTLRFQTILSQQASRMDLDNFVLFCT